MRAVEIATFAWRPPRAINVVRSKLVDAFFASTLAFAKISQQITLIGISGLSIS